MRSGTLSASLAGWTKQLRTSSPRTGNIEHKNLQLSAEFIRSMLLGRPVERVAWRETSQQRKNGQLTALRPAQNHKPQQWLFAEPKRAGSASIRTYFAYAVAVWGRSTSRERLHSRDEDRIRQPGLAAKYLRNTITGNKGLPRMRIAVIFTSRIFAQLFQK